MSKTKSRKVKSPYSRTVVKTDVLERRTRAVQSERNRSDINNIVARAHKTGQLPVLVGRKPVPSMPDVESYQDAMNKVVFAQQQFERLPSEIRTKFSNDPRNMLDAIEKAEENPEVKTFLQEIGLLNKPDPDPVTPAEQSSEAANGGEATAKPSGDPVPTAS